MKVLSVVTFLVGCAVGGVTMAVRHIDDVERRGIEIGTAYSCGYAAAVGQIIGTEIVSNDRVCSGAKRIALALGFDTTKFGEIGE